MSFSHCFILVYCHSDTPSSLLIGMATICLHWCLYPNIWAIIKHLGPEPQIKALNIFRLCASWYLSLHKQLNCQSMQCSCNMYKRHHKDKRPQYLYFPSHNWLFLMEKLNPQLRKKIYFCCDILDFIASEKLAAFHINLEVTWRYDTIDCIKYGMILKTYYHKSLFWIALPKEKNLCVISQVWSKDMSSNSWGPFN